MTDMCFYGCAVCQLHSLWEADCMDSARLTLDGILGGEAASGQRSGWSWGVLGWPLSPTVLNELWETMSCASGFRALIGSLASAVVSLGASAATLIDFLSSLCRWTEFKYKWAWRIMNSMNLRPLNKCVSSRHSVLNHCCGIMKNDITLWLHFLQVGLLIYNKD